MTKIYPVIFGALVGLLLFGADAALALGDGSGNNGACITCANPTSTLTPPAYTGGYTATTGFIANSATAGSVTAPCFTLGVSGLVPRVELAVADTAAGWLGSVIQLDLYRGSTTLTFNAGDHAAFSLKAGALAHIGTYLVTLTMQDTTTGISGEGQISPGNFAAIRLASGTSLCWTAQYLSASTGTIGSSHVLTTTWEVIQ